jgi:tetratricopeptide (TPR) repeat protein
MRAIRLSTIARNTLLAACAASFCTFSPVPAASKQAIVPWRTTLAAAEQRLTVHDLSGAEAYFRQALTAVRMQSPRATDDIAYCMERLAAVLQMQDIREEGSLDLYKRAVRLTEHKHGKNDPRLIPLLNAIGAIYAQDVNLPQARKYYTRSLQLAHLAHEPLTIAEIERALGNIAFSLGDTTVAEANYTASLARLMAQPELPNAESLQQVLSDYINLYMHDTESARTIPSKFQTELLKDRLAELQKTQATPQSNFAKAVSGRLVEITEQAVPSTGTAGATTLPTIKPDRSMPDFAALQSIDQQRVDFYERMIETDIKSLGPRHPSVARDLTGLAAVYIREKNYAKAKPLLNKALEIYSTVYGADALLSRKTAALMSLITEDEQDQLRFGSQPVVNSFVLHLQPVPPQSGKLEVALGMNYLAQMLFTYGKPEEASRVYAWALADTVLATGENSPLTAATLADYGKVLRNRGEMKLAEEMESSSRRILRNLKTQEAVLSLP